MPAHSDAVTVEVAFGAAPDATSPTWTDVSSYVRTSTGITYTNGDTSDERFIPSAGDLTLTLDNSDDRFNPDNASGPYYGDLDNYTPIRLKYDGTAVWRGVIDSGWRLSFAELDAVAEVTAVDALGYLANIAAPGSRYQGLVDSHTPVHAIYAGGTPGTWNDVIVGELLDASYGQWSLTGSFMASATDEQVAVAGSVCGTRNPVDTYSITNTLDDDQAMSYEQWLKLGSSGYVTGFPYSSGVSLDSQYLRVYWNASSGSGKISYWERPEEMGLTSGGIYQTVVVFAAPAAGVTSEPTVYLNGVELPAAYSTQTLPYNWDYDPEDSIIAAVSNCTLGPYHAYPKALTAAEVAALYEAGTQGFYDGETIGDRIEWLADTAGWSLHAITAGEGMELAANYEEGGSTLEAIRKLCATENGRVLVDTAGYLRFYPQGWWTKSNWSPTFDEGSNIRYRNQGAYITQSTSRFANHVEVGRVGAAGAAMVAKDDTSIAAVGRRDYSLTGLYLPSDDLAQLRAVWELARRLHTGVRAEEIMYAPTLGNEADVSSLNRVFALVYQAGYLVKATVTKSPSGGGSDITTTAYLSGISGTITDSVHEVVWYLEGTVSQMNDEGAFGEDWGTAKWGL